MIKENDLAAMNESGQSNDKIIAEFIQNLDLEAVASFIEIEVRNEKEALTLQQYGNKLILQPRLN